MSSPARTPVRTRDLRDALLLAELIPGATLAMGLDDGRVSIGSADDKNMEQSGALRSLRQALVFYGGSRNAELARIQWIELGGAAISTGAGVYRLASSSPARCWTRRSSSWRPALPTN